MPSMLDPHTRARMLERLSSLAVHPLFGPLSGKMLGKLLHKHWSHHLEQFGV